MKTRTTKDFRINLLLTMATAICCGAAWILVLDDKTQALPWAAMLTLLAAVAAWRLTRLYQRHMRKVLFLLEAIENDDSAIHFSEHTSDRDDRAVNEALNRTARMLHEAKRRTAQQERYYELILDSVDTGIVVLNKNGMVYQKNNKAMRLLGLSVFTHIGQLQRTAPALADMLRDCREGEKKQARLYNERATVNLAVRVSRMDVHGETLRIIALDDIDHELDEKEMESWTRLTRVLTHEIMNAVTPMTSLSDTLLTRTGHENHPCTPQELRDGLRTISDTGKGLLSFVDSYRRFTSIPAPKPSLFYAEPFLRRMTELAAHQYPGSGIRMDVDVKPSDLILHADEQLIAQVVTNLLKNAMQSILSSPTSATCGQISVKAYSKDGETVSVEITDNGPAIPPEIAEHIFIPFFTTKEDGNGIGLSVSRQIMRLSGGSLTLMPEDRKTFVLHFD